MSPQAPVNSNDDQMRPEYDFSQGVRGKHYQTYRAGTNVVFLEPDLATVVPDSASVNQALRLLVKLAQTKGLFSGRSNNYQASPSQVGRSSPSGRRPKPKRRKSKRAR